MEIPQEETRHLAGVVTVGRGWREIALAAAVVLLLGHFLARPSSAAGVDDLQISEFMAANGTTLTDEDGDTPDWIEIFNPSSAAVDLAGWRLTDDPSDPAKWIFPALVLGAGEYLVVFASDKNRNDPAGELHCNFKLSAGGEYLALVKPDGVTVTSSFAPAYPPQVADVSYGHYVAGATVENLVGGSDARVLVPEDGGLGLSWTQAGFVTTPPWLSGSGQGVGYDTTPKYDVHITTDIQAEMYTQNPSAYIRLPFTIDDATRYQDLALHIRWEDGFVAYLNGVQVASRAAPASPVWDSTSLDGIDRFPESEVLVPEVIDLGASLGELQDGDNVLAVHALNSMANSSDLLIECELRSTRSGDGELAVGYLTVPSPGAAGGPGEAGLAALIGDAAHSPAAPGGSDPVTVTAAVAPALVTLDSVTLHYRAMFGSEASLPMFDDGNHGDGAAGDGVFGGTIPAGTAAAGEMLRWYITARDVGGASSRWPVYSPGARTAEYLGTVVADPTITSQLPLFQYFIEDTDWYIEPGAGLYNKDYTAASVYYLGRFYDNVRVKIRGASSVFLRFPKQSLHFDFPSNNRLHRGEGLPPVDEINTNQLWTDKAYVRYILSMMSVYRVAGVAYSEVFPLLTYRNGDFFSVALYIEEPDTDYLERHGLDPDGAFYKMHSPLTSAAVFPEFFPGMNNNNFPGAKKRTRQHEDHSDLQAIVDGTAPGAPGRNAFLYDNFDVPQIINYVAASILTQDSDRYGKNHFMYRDSDGTGLWQMHPWDPDLSWGYAGWMTDSTSASTGTMSHPLYGEASYPSVFGQTHRLVDAFHDQPPLREMFLRRLRTLMDEILQPPGTPVAERVLETEVERLYDLMHAEVDADKAKWGNPFGTPQTLRQAVDSVLNNYIAPRRNNLYNPANYGGIIPGPQPAAPVINFGPVIANPGGDQGGEYAVVQNPNSYAVDISGWRVDGGIRFTFAPGTVIHSGGSAYLTPDVPAFQARASSPKGGEGRLVLGEYRGQLSARGETLTLLRPDASVAATVSYPGNPSPAQDYLRVGEVHFAPPPPTAAESAALPGAGASDFEFIELVNIGPAALDLGGCRFVDGVTFPFPASTDLPPGARLVVAANPAAFALRYPGVTPAALGPWTGRLDNDGETIELVDAGGERVLQFSYNDSWYPAAEDLGHSLVVRDAANTPFDAWGEVGNWAVSASAGGTPGAGDTAFGRNYDDWVYEHFTAAEQLLAGFASPLGDADSDGHLNVIEFALGGDPRSAGSTPEWDLVGGGGEVEISFRSFPSTVDYSTALESSLDFDVWQPVTDSPVSEEPAADGSIRHTFRFASGVGRRVFRVRISPVSS